MESINQFVMLLVGLGLVTALVATTYVLFRASLSKANMDALRQDNVDLRNRVDDQSKELLECKASEKTLEEKVAHYREENGMLLDMVIQRAEVDEVKADVRKLFQELNIHHTATLQVLEEIKEGVNNG